MHTAPDCETRPRRPGRAGVRAKVALSPASVRMSPRQFGPRIRTPPRFAAASIASWSVRPSLPASANPLESTAAALIPARAASSITPGTVAAGVTTTARSTFPSSSLRRRATLRPNTSRCLRLTG